MRIGAPLNSEPKPVLQWIEIATFFQIPSFHIIGLPNPEVSEARDRIRSAIEASHFEFPRRRVVINLSPASVRKRGTGLDLSMALSVLTTHSQSQGSIFPRSNSMWIAWGELGLDGTVKPAGQLVRAIYATWDAQVPFLLLSREEYDDALLKLDWIRQGGELQGSPPLIIPVRTLNDAWSRLLEIETNGKITETFEETRSKDPQRSVGYLRGKIKDGRRKQKPSLLPLSPSMERVLSTAAAGSLHLLLLGPRGTGKSHALDWLEAIQPPLSASKKITNALLSELGDFNPIAPETDPDIFSPPVRKVSSQVKSSALIGGVSSFTLRPGEFTRAHGGLLIADEFLEWPRDSREALREPLERGTVTISRTSANLELPAQFSLAANGNLCPCGGWPPSLTPQIRDQPHSFPACNCTPGIRQSYLARLSGPIMDRLDLLILVTDPMASLTHFCDSSSKLASLREKVIAARNRMIKNWGNPAGQISSGQLEELIERHPSLNSQLRFVPPSSLRSRHKILRLALSLAAWDDEDLPSGAHFTEAQFYRPERLGLGD